MYTTSPIYGSHPESKCLVENYPLRPFIKSILHHSIHDSVHQSIIIV